MKTLKIAVIAAVFIFAAMQFVGPRTTNPATDPAKTLHALADVPPGVDAIFKRSCNDCHTNDTRWPWYSNVAPASWFTVDHVNEGRAELNFSEWGNYDENFREQRRSAVCGIVEYGSMPLGSYLWIHSEARLSREDVEAICSWARSKK